MTYLVTGGTGFIGAYVARDLVQSGERVVCFDIDPNARLLGSVVRPDQLQRVTIVRGDVTDWAQLLHALREHRVDKVIHLASLLTSSSEANFPLALKVNCQGTDHILEGAALMGLEKVVWASSVAVFGPRSQGPDGIVLNDAPHDPQTVYGACKSYNEQMALHYVRKYDLDVIGLRFTLVYGYGKTETVARGTGVDYLTELIDKPALGQGPCVVPYGDDQMDWLYVEDAARAIVLASKAGRTRTKAFTVRGDLRPMREVFDYVRTLLPNADMMLHPGSYRQIWQYDGSVTREEIGYVPEYKIEEGMKRNINMLRQVPGLPLVG
ncbi:MAG: NAD(P)-dependent oxidoreductase [Nitrospinae bacterium]|nr:NAD(P)-dependent oxidoreductase [Nitrospinota bacterium]